MSGQVGEPSEKTKENFRRAQCRSLWAGPLHIEWKAYTGTFFFLPRWEFMLTEFWQEGPIQWFRCYWLTVGISIYKPFADRRNPGNCKSPIARLGVERRK